MTRLVAVVVVALALAVGGCSRDEPRASGVAERFLQAVSDMGREGLREDARERVEEYGDPAVADRLIQDDAAEDERHFADLEVGRTTGDGLVPFRVTMRLEGDQTTELAGSLRVSGGRVVGLDPANADAVPSEGGALPARASAQAWLLSLGLGVVLTILSVVLVEAMPRRAA